jgi:hypothetical protein
MLKVALEKIKKLHSEIDKLKNEPKKKKVNSHNNEITDINSKIKNPIRNSVLNKTTNLNKNDILTSDNTLNDIINKYQSHHVSHEMNMFSNMFKNFNKTNIEEVDLNSVNKKIKESVMEKNEMSPRQENRNLRHN